MLKTFIAITMGTFVFISAAQAAEVTSYGALKNNYSFPEFGFTQTEKTVIQGGSTVAFDNGAYLDVWGSRALDGDEVGNEIDFTAGWRGTCGTFTCHTAVSFFDIPTPEVGDFSPDNDLFRLRVEVSDMYQINESDSFDWYVGADQMTGFLETNLWRAGGGYTHKFSDSLSGRVGGKVAYNADPDTTTPSWDTSLIKSFETWSVSVNLGGYESPNNGEGHTFTYGVGFSRTW